LTSPTGAWYGLSDLQGATAPRASRLGAIVIVGGARVAAVHSGESGAHMTAKAWGLQPRAVDELFFQNDAVSLCMLIARRARTMRVIDFRAGPTHAKRVFVMSIAQREGVRKVFTLVERDEVPTWQKLGFAKEGTIPCFYKRSDALVLGCPVPQAPVESNDVPLQSETRIAVASPTPPSGAHELLDLTIAAGKRGLREWTDKLPPAKATPISEPDMRRAVALSQRRGRALTAFEAFGRDVERHYFSVSVRGGFELVASVECQPCFGNAFLELLESPRTDAEKLATSAAVRALCALLLEKGTVSCFSLAPSDDVGLASAFLHNGFRRSGLLMGHLVAGGRRKDAIVWSRKLALPTED
jgi:hypothetical protein